MKIVFKIMLAILIIMALASGTTKLLLMKQEVEFFGAYGFTNPLLILFGVSQFLAGLLMISGKTRLSGAVILNITFFISFVVLMLAGKVVLALITLLPMAALGFVIYKSRRLVIQT